MKKNNEVAKRSIFIINKPFQIKYSLLLALIGLFVSILFGAHIFYFLNQYLVAIIPSYAEHEQIKEFVQTEKTKIFLYLVVLSLLLSSFLFFLGIIVTHKIAGPIMVIKRKMADVESGNIQAYVKLRKGDEFKDLAKSFNSMLDSLLYLFKRS